MAELTWPAVAAAACSGGVAVERLFTGRVEAERRTVAPAVLKGFRRAGRDWQALLRPDGTFVPGEDNWTRHAQQQALALALVGCATASELARLGWHHELLDLDAAYRMLCDRRPDWTGAWVEHMLRRPAFKVPDVWRLARRLVHEGLIPAPASDDAIAVMIAAFVHQPELRVRAELDADPALLEHEVWRIFEVDGGELGGLAVCDPVSRAAGNWSEALRGLAAEGRLDRDRLLDASLDALARDFPAARTSWYTRFHEALEPTDAERAARVDAYLGLLASPVPPTVGFALRTLRRLPAGTCDLAVLVERLPAALASDRKGVVKDALGLLDRIAKAQPALAEDCAVAAAGALQHPAPDVQQHALTRISDWAGAPPSGSVRAALLAYADVVAPTAQPAFGALAGAAAPEPEGGADPAALAARAAALPPEIAEAVGVPAALAAARAGTLDPALPPVPAADEPVLGDPIAPVTELEALGDLLARGLERLDTAPEDVERSLDGIARLCADRASFARELAPLLQRITATGMSATPVGRAVVAWATGAVPPAFDGWHRLPDPGIERFLHDRADEVAARAAALRPAPLLALPTHRGGWIAPDELVRRVAALDGPPLRLDLIQALHRLAPGGRAGALAAAAPLRGDAAAALRYALGGPLEGGEPLALLAGWAVRGDPDEPPPVAQVAGRTPRRAIPPGGFRVEPVVERWPGAEPIRRLRVVAQPPPKPDVAQPAAWLQPRHVAGEDPWVRVLQPWLVPHLRAAWPGGHDVLLARAAAHLADWFDHGGAFADGGAFLAPLLDPGVPVPRVGAEALVVGLAARDAATGGAAVDAVVAVIADGRLDAAGLTAPLRRLLPEPSVVLGRVGGRLATVAAESPLHAEVVRIALDGALTDALAGRRDLHALLEPLNELCAAAGCAIGAPDARALLSGFSGGSKTARLAQSLLARDGESSLMPAAAALAAHARVVRAERWAA